MIAAREVNEGLARLREYLLLPDRPNVGLHPKWLAGQLGLVEREMLGILAYGLKDGLVAMHWEVVCPACQMPVSKLDTLRDAHGQAECAACELEFDVHLDREVRVTFSASERLQRERGESLELPASTGEMRPTTRGLDLLLVPAFRELFAGEAPAPDESLRIARVALLFTDIVGSTAMYAQRGDPLAYRLVRDHFGILGEAIEKNRGALVKTIGDAVMASFASGSDAIRAAFEAQTELAARTDDMGADLVIKVGIHAGACLGVTLNGRLDFFGGAVNTAARVQGLSHGHDVVVTDAILAEPETEAARSASQFCVTESFDARLRGLPAPVHVHRLKPPAARDVDDESGVVADSGPDPAAPTKRPFAFRGTFARWGQRTATRLCGKSSLTSRTS